MGNKRLLDAALQYGSFLNLIHIGAHRGEEIPLYEQYNLHSVYLIEPIEYCEKIIQEKIRLLDNFYSFNCALGSENKFSTIYLADGEDSGSSSLLSPRESDIAFSNSQQIEVKTFTSLNLEKIDMVVIDTQGYEIEVLKGFDSYLDGVNFFIVEFANYEGYINQPTYKKLNKFMKSKGFIVVDQIKRINKPFPTINGGSFGDALYVNKTLLNFTESIYFNIKYYIINNVIYDSIIFYKKTLKRKLKSILNKD